MKRIVTKVKCNICETYYDRVRGYSTHDAGVCSEKCYISAPRTSLKQIKTALEKKMYRIERKKLKRAKNIEQRNKQKGDFYKTDEWLRLRYQVLKTYGRCCMACGAVSGSMHVDHIQPRSRFPDLELVFDNMQVLCADCNMGKSNKDYTDFRCNHVMIKP